MTKFSYRINDTINTGRILLSIVSHDIVIESMSELISVLEHLCAVSISSLEDGKFALFMTFDSVYYDEL
jgi:hypothetical protein